MGRAASAFIEATIAAGDHIGISAISLAERACLIEKARIPKTSLDDVIAAITDPKNVLKDIALDDRIAINMRNIPRQDIPDLPDRIIAATALMYDVPVLSRDGRIRRSNIKTIWQFLNRAFRQLNSRRSGSEPSPTLCWCLQRYRRHSGAVETCPEYQNRTIN